MKKIITLSLLLVTFAFTATFASAQTNFPQQGRYDQNRRDDQRNDRRNDRRNNDWRRERVETQTRVVRKGNKVYRETVRITYKRNGKVETKVINRTRIR